METHHSSVKGTRNVRRLLLALSLLALAIAVARAMGFSFAGLSRTADGTPEQNRLHQPNDHAIVSVEWYEGADGYAKADASNRALQASLIVYFYTDWCPYCKKFDRDILPSNEVSQFMKSVIKVRINPERGSEERALANRFGVHGYPSIFVVPAQTELPKKIYPFRRVGETFEALDPSEFVKACREAGAP